MQAVNWRSYYLTLLTFVTLSCLLPAQQFTLNVRDADQIDTGNSSDRGIFGGDVIAGDMNDSSSGYHVPIQVQSISGFDNTTTTGQIRLTADLTQWNSDNTQVNPQGVKFAFTINVVGNSTGGNGYLNGTYFGRLGIDDTISGESWTTIETGESATFSISDITVLEAPEGKTVKFNSFGALDYWGSTRTGVVLSNPTLDTLTYTADSGTGPTGFDLNFEIVDNPNDLTLSTEKEIVASQDATNYSGQLRLAEFSHDSRIR